MPKTTPKTTLTLSEAELDIVSESLLVAQQTLLDLAHDADKYTHRTQLAEQLRLYAEEAADVQQKIERRP